MLTFSHRIPITCIFIIFLVGCAGKAQISSERNPQFRGYLSQIVVVHSLDDVVGSSDKITGRSYSKIVEDQLKVALAAAGVKTVFLSLPEDKVAARIDAVVKEHSAHEVLILDYVQGTINVAGHHYRADFDARIIDTRSDQMIWSAKIVWEPGGNAVSVEERASVFVNELIAALTRDGLLRGRQPV